MFEDTFYSDPQLCSESLRLSSVFLAVSFAPLCHFMLRVLHFVVFQKQKKQKSQSGYLVFSHEMRNIIRKDHPEYAFGEISRIVGVEVGFL